MNLAVCPGCDRRLTAAALILFERRAVLEDADSLQVMDVKCVHCGMILERQPVRRHRAV